MMAAASLSQSRALAGCRAMTVVQRAPTVKQVSNGSKYFMRRKGSFMVEVHVSEEETEDQAVKRYMRAVLQSGVLNKLRARRTKETKIEMKKRKLFEKAQARKMGIEEPSWEEVYGENQDEAKPFDEYFCKPGDGDEAFDPTTDSLPALDAVDLFGYGTNEIIDLSRTDLSMQGSYINQGQQQQQLGGYAAAGQAQQ